MKHSYSGHVFTNSTVFNWRMYLQDIISCCSVVKSLHIISLVMSQHLYPIKIQVWSICYYSLIISKEPVLAKYFQRMGCWVQVVCSIFSLIGMHFFQIHINHETALAWYITSIPSVLTNGTKSLCICTISSVKEYVNILSDN